MKTYEIQPTDENILKTLLEDTIGRDKDIRYFIQTLDKLEGHWSISLDSQWGSGKTFFVKQTKLVLEAFNDNIEKDIDESDVPKIKYVFNNDLGITQSFLPIYYDAWANDNDEDPILSLIYQITQDIEIYYDIKNLPNFAEIGINICNTLTGRDFKSLFESLKSVNPLEHLEKEKGLQEEINEFFNRLIEERAERLVIFVDELDRCKPTYAVRFLERIKHYFANDNIIFVFSINSTELQHTIKRFYGNDFNAYEYLTKFFNLPISLPEADMSSYYRSINYNDVSQNWYDMITRAVINYYNFDIRTISHYLQQEQMCDFKRLHPSSGDYIPNNVAFRNVSVVFVPIMIGLKIHDIIAYNRFIRGEAPEILIDILSECEFKEHVGDFLFNKSQNSWSEIEEDIRLLYNTIMNFSKLYQYGTKRIGKLEIDNSTKNKLLKQAELISEQSDLLKENK